MRKRMRKRKSKSKSKNKKRTSKKWRWKRKRKRKQMRKHAQGDVKRCWKLSREREDVPPFQEEVGVNWSNHFSISLEYVGKSPFRFVFWKKSVKTDPSSHNLLAYKADFIFARSSQENKRNSFSRMRFVAQKPFNSSA
jgi:hypothetical protein